MGNCRLMVVFELEMVGNGGRKGVSNDYSLRGEEELYVFIL